jgi:hypothetical protein
MRRRDFGKTSLGIIGASVFANTAKGEALPGPGDFQKTSGLTKYVGDFVVQAKYEAIPANVIAPGKKYILDGLGFATAG